MSDYNEWSEAGYCVMASSLAFILYIIPSILGGLL